MPKPASKQATTATVATASTASAAEAKEKIVKVKVEKIEKIEKEKKVKATPVASASTTVVSASPASTVVPASTSASTSAPAGAEEASASVAVVPEDVEILMTQTAEFFTKLNEVSSAFSVLKGEFRSLEKKWGREMKAYQKILAKRKSKSATRKESGFVIPTEISDELATFLKKPLGSKMSRTEVTKAINRYVKENHLGVEKNINQDASLQALLKIESDKQLTYFNLQKYLAPHFPKTKAKVAAAALAAASSMA